MNSKLKNENTDCFYRAVLGLKSVEECYAFFEDICTISEIQAMTQRFYVARLLSAGKTYQEISSLTGASTATISRINKCIEYGADGYKTALGRLDNDIS
ncbi:MAG: hypothetical protein IKM44_01535 [Clostridia bacterium]|nr:hypothetical protein [Clostridia bacterium]